MHDVLVTGGAGFIGSHFVRRLLAAGDVARVTVLDALTYAGSRENLGDAFLSPKLAFAEGLAQTVEWYRDNPGRWAPLLRNRQARLPRISLAGARAAAS